VPWVKHRLRDSEVWAKVDDRGVLAADRDGRVEVVYKPASGAKVYRAGAKNLVPLGDTPIELEPDAGASHVRGGTSPAANAIQVWTDGACTGNPGPAGIGVVILDGDQRTEISEYLGHGTNNIAELTAILRGLQRVSDQSRPVIVYSDSAYSIGLLTQAWKAKANKELVEELRATCRQFADLQFVKVAGHAGIALNERVDELARTAIVRGR
jgi:ribonuclease HI